MMTHVPQWLTDMEDPNKVAHVEEAGTPYLHREMKNPGARPVPSPTVSSVPEKATEEVGRKDNPSDASDLPTDPETDKSQSKPGGEE